MRAIGLEARAASPARPPGARPRAVMLSGPGAWRLAWRMQLYRLEVLDELARHEAPVVLSVFPKRFVFLFDPADAALALGEAYARFDKGLGLSHARHALGGGMLSASGEAWRRSRVAQARTLGHCPVEPSAAAVRRYVRQRIESRPDREHRVAAASFGVDVAAEGLAVAVFGHEDGAELRDIFATLQAALEPVRDALALPEFTLLPFLLRHTPRARAALGTLVGWADRQVSLARRPGASGLLPAIAGRTGFDDRALRDEVITLLVAGLETTGAALAWCLLHLRAHPDWAARLRDEAVAQGHVPGPVPLTASFVAEVLRLRPPVWMISRRARQALSLPGVEIRKGDEVLIPVWSLHRDPAGWEAPELFDPRRFSDRDGASSPSYMPFGAGPRICVGRRMGLAELAAAVSEIVRLCDVAAEPGRSGRIEKRVGLTLFPEAGETVTLCRR